MEHVINIIVAGLGGQGVLTASDILAAAAFNAGLDVKKADVHGMAQRGGSVRSDVRFGPRVFSPMVPPGEADFLVLLADDQREHHAATLRPTGVTVLCSSVDADRLPNRKSLNTALLGALSLHLEIPPAAWHDAIRNGLKPAVVDANLAAFELGRAG